MDIYWSLLTVHLWTCTILTSTSGELHKKRITNVSFANNEQFPYIVKVVINGINCSGIIFNKRFVATGRQCIGDYDNRKYNPHSADIYANYRSKISSDYEDEGVKKVRVISAYCYSEDDRDNQLPYDLCLLKVFPRFVWTSTVNVATLPGKTEWPVGQKESCLLVTYAEGFAGDGTRPLRSRTLIVKHPQTCASLNKSQHMDRLLCSNLEDGFVPHAGDTGAPLACGSYVIAILQGNYKKAYGKPVNEISFIYLPPYLSFIETVLLRQPERYRVRFRSSAVSYISNPKQDLRFYILFFIFATSLWECIFDKYYT